MALHKYTAITSSPVSETSHFQLKRDSTLGPYSPMESFIGTIRTHRQTGTIVLLECGLLLTTAHLICNFSKAMNPMIALEDCYDPINTIRLEFITPQNQLLVVGIERVVFDGLQILAQDGFSVTGWDIALLKPTHDLRPSLGAGLKIGAYPDHKYDSTFISRPAISADNYYTRIILHRMKDTSPAAAEWESPQYQTFQSYGFSPGIPSFSGGIELQGDTAVSIKYQTGLQFNGITVAEKIKWFETGVYRNSLALIDRSVLPTFFSQQRFIGKTEKQAPYFKVLMDEAEARVQHEISWAISLFRDCANKEKEVNALQTENNPQCADKVRVLKNDKKISQVALTKSRKLLMTWLNGGAEHFGKQKFNSLSDFEGFLERIKCDLIGGAKHYFVIAATEQFNRTANSKKPVILGNRQAVAEFAQTHTILDVGIWSWGVNQAFIEGISSKNLPVILHTSISDCAQKELIKSKVVGQKFLKWIEESAKEDQALWHGIQNRPTWYALEIAGLLDLGYRLNIDPQTKMIKQDPDSNQKISTETSKIGIDTYLKTARII